MKQNPEEEVTKEADFYGSMDGASKFVKGDAIAGILILVVNIVGGLIIGLVQHDLPIGQAAEAYILLAIGDGWSPKYHRFYFLLLLQLSLHECHLLKTCLNI